MSDASITPLSRPSSERDVVGAFATIPEAVAAIGRGEIIVVVDDEDRENEGDLIMAAEAATPEKIAFFVRHTALGALAPGARVHVEADVIGKFVQRLVEPYLETGRVASRA